MRTRNLHMARPKALASTLLMPTVAACGGGGGSQSGASQSDGTLSIGAALGSVSLNYYGDGSAAYAVRYFYPKDLQGDAGQELLVAGLETQPNTPAAYSDTRAHVVSISAGVPSDVTDAVLPAGGGQLEAVGDVVFGDFNADGRLDFFTTAYADMDHVVTAYEFQGGADGYTRRAVDNSQWQHGAASGDLNSDGFDDVLVLGYRGAEAYLGSLTGLREYTVAGDYAGGSGVALADFLGNGRLQAIGVDAGPTGSDDTILYQIVVDGATERVTLTELGRLPSPRLEGDAFASRLPGVSERSHDVRAEPLDFNSDGRVDVVVFSRGAYDAAAGNWPELSQVQFLRNDGGGLFTDVTDAVLPNYDAGSNVSYVPVFADFNEDGFLDIFLSESDWQGAHNSSVFLMGGPAGVFTEAGRGLLSQLIPGGGAMASVVEDAAGDFYLVVGTQPLGDTGRQELLTTYALDFL